MEVAVDAFLAVPLLFTVLAVLLASLYLKFRPSDTKEQAASSKVDATSEAAEEPEGAAGGEVAKKTEDVSEEQAEEPGRAKGRVTVEELGAEEGKGQSPEPQNQPEREPAPQGAEAASPKTSEAQPEPSPKTSEAQPQPNQPEKVKKEQDEAEVDSTKKSLPDVDNEDVVDEYRPGKIRGSSYEKTLTREELEEEQRIQHEQLAAIFNLMKEKKETFGEMSEGEMEEQLRLYSL